MYYEDFNAGDKFTTRSRHITGTDMDMFAILTGALNPKFINDKAAQAIGLERRMSPGALTLSYSIGAVFGTGLYDHLTALAGLDVDFTAPVNEGDELTSVVEVVEKREMKRPDRGLVTIKWSCTNQDGKKVMEVKKFVFVAERKV